MEFIRAFFKIINFMESVDIAIVIAVLISVVILFAWEKFSIDIVAFIALAALLLFQVITPREAVSGFSHPATITVASMFVLSAGLERTGAVRKIGHLIVRFGKSQGMMLVLVMVSVGVISAFINNTGVVAVFLPIVVAACAKRKIAKSKILMPMSVASQAAGVCTLIGTSTNIIVSGISEQAGFGAFAMFELGQFGLILFFVTLLYFLIFGKFLLPERYAEDFSKSYELGDYITELRVIEGSSLIGVSIRESQLRKEYDIKILKILRKGRKVIKQDWAPLQEGDILLIESKIKEIMDIKDRHGLEINPKFKLQDKNLIEEDLILVEVVVAPNSKLIGHTLSDLDFHRRFKAVCLAVQRREKTLHEKLDDIILRLGDMLLLQGSEKEIDKLRKNRNFIVLEEVEEGGWLKRKTPIALGIILLVVLLAALNIMPIMASAILGSLSMLLTGCLDTDEAYRAIDWKVIFLLAGILPLGIAMSKTGAAELITKETLGFLGSYGPLAAFAGLYIVTAILTEAMSNNAAAVLLAPIAISTALEFGVDPKPFLMAVTFAASTSFATPVGYQTNAMIYSPGGYKYTDFLKVGIPLNLIFWVLAIIFIPQLWPFN